MGTVPEGFDDAPNLTVQEVADTVGLSYHAVLRAVHRGEVRAYKVCGRVRLRREDVLTWIRACTVEFERQVAREAASVEPGSREHLRELERRHQERRNDRG